MTVTATLMVVVMVMVIVNRDDCDVGDHHHAADGSEEDNSDAVRLDMIAMVSCACVCGCALRFFVCLHKKQVGSFGANQLSPRRSSRMKTCCPARLASPRRRRTGSETLPRGRCYGVDYFLIN